MSVIIDQNERDQAINIAHSYIVQAPAGSGKTGLITQRYLNLLAHVTEPEAVLAITFTRKAAAEMRERILEALLSVNEACPVDPHAAKTWLLAGKVVEQSNQLGWNLTLNPQRLRVQTIDSFCASVVQQMPLLAKSGLYSGIVENPTRLYRNTVEQLIQQALIERAVPELESSLKILLSILNNRMESLVELLMKLLGKRDQWIRHFLTNEKLLLREDLEYAFEQVNIEFFLRFQTQVPNTLGIALMELFNRVIANPELIASLENEHPIFIWKDVQSFPDGSVETKEQWIALAEFLLTSSGTLRKKIDKSLGFVAQTAVKGKENKALVKTLKDECSALLSEIAQHEQFIEDLVNVRNLPDITFTDEHWSSISAIGDVLKYLLAFLQLEFQSSGQVDFIEINLAAHRALNNNEGVTDLGLKLDHKIQHILIDEFQDTSFSQYQLLSALTEEWELNDGKTLFVVGDPMQSIYRFREADVGLYLQSRRKGINHLQLTPLTLKTNFRSQKHIVDWVNRSFSQVFPKQENISLGAVTLSEAVAFNQSDQQSVHCHFTFEQENQTQSKKVVELIKLHRQEYPEQSIAVLVKAKAHAFETIELLKQNQIPVNAVEMEPLASRPMIMNLRNLTRILVNSSDKLALAGLLRSQLCGLSIKGMHLILEKKHFDWYWLVRLVENNLWNELSEGIDESDKKIVTRLVSDLLPLIESTGTLPLSQRIEKAWFRLAGAHLYQNERDVDDKKSFIQLIETHLNQTGLYQVSQLDELIDNLFSASSNQPSAVQVMSIHKSKGLEFDCVILPFLEKRADNRDDSLILWQESSDLEPPANFLVAPKSKDKQDKFQPYVRNIYQQKAQFELGRLLYVAATRAKKSCHLFANFKTKENKQGEIEVVAPSSAQFIAPLWPVISEEVANQFASQVIGIEEANPSAEVFSLKRRTVEPITLTLPKKFEVNDFYSTLASDKPSGFDNWEQEKAALVGSLVHQFLHQFSETNDSKYFKLTDRHDRVMRQYFKMHFVPDDEIEEAVTRVQFALEQMFSDKLGQWIMQPRASTKSEWALTSSLGNQIKSLIIDRSFVDDNTRWIIDFKVIQSNDALSSEEESLIIEQYRTQLFSYARLLRLMGDDDIQCALYLPNQQRLLKYARNFDLHQQETV